MINDAKTAKTNDHPLVGIIMGSTSDWETMEYAAKTLALFPLIALRTCSSNTPPGQKTAASKSSSPAQAEQLTCPA